MRAKRQIFGIIVKLTLCALFLGTVSYAWIAANRDTAGGGIEMQIDGESMSVTDYRVFRYNSETNSIDEITDPGVDRYDLVAYDSIFLERNVNTPLLLRAELEGIPAGSTHLTFTVSCLPEHDQPRTVDNGQDRWTSDILYVNYATQSTVYGAASEPDLSTAEGRETMYDTVVGYLLSNSAASTRVQFANAEPVNNMYEYVTGVYDASTNPNGKVTDIPCEVPVANGESTVVLYMIFDYAVDLIRAQHIDNFSDIDITLGQSIVFGNDIRLITFTGITNN